MKEILVTYYVAEDGKKFTSKQECYEHECELKKIQNWFRTLESIRAFCAEHDGCENCPFLNDSHCGFTNECTETVMENAPYSWDFKDWEGFR